MAHYYNAAGELVEPWVKDAWPSPTTILDILAKPELEAYRQRIGEIVADELMTNAQERGTRVHSACEQLLCNDLADADVPGIVVGIAEEDLPFVLGFVNWWNSNDVLLLETELFLESRKYKYRGRTDLVVLLDGQEWIIDIKTGSLRWSHGYQLKFYEQAYYEMTGQRCRMGVLGLTDKTKCGYHRLKEVKTPLISILSLKHIFDDIQKHNPIKPPKDSSAIWKR